MAIPDYQSIMLPLLKLMGDKKEHTTKEIIEDMVKLFGLSKEERNMVLPSGRSYIINNRVGWALTYLKKAELISSHVRSRFNITDLGMEILLKNPPKINNNFLQQFTKFIEFKNLKGEKGKYNNADLDEKSVQTPQELMEDGYQSIKHELAQELLSLVKQNSPRFFENLVVELLISMGYGGSRKDAGQAIGQSNDGGIDGIIKEDKLGLDIIYIQAKRWENVVGAPEIRNFLGSLSGKKANKGVFITTSNFSKEALEYIKTIVPKVILVDGEMLVQLMIDNNVGVTNIINYNIKKIDSDYFIEE